MNARPGKSINGDQGNLGTVNEANTTMGREEKGWTRRLAIYVGLTAGTPQPKLLVSGSSFDQHERPT